MLYEVDYTLRQPEFGFLNVEADDAEDAEFKATAILKEAYQNAQIEIEMIRMHKD